MIDRLDQRHLGHRVVVRYRIGARSGRPLFTDALGELIEWTDGELVVRTARGDVRVAIDRIVLAKPVPPKAVRIRRGSGAPSDDPNSA